MHIFMILHFDQHIRYSECMKYAEKSECVLSDKYIVADSELCGTELLVAYSIEITQ